MIGYLLFKAMHKLALLLPRKGAYWLGKRIGDIYYFCAYRNRKSVYANIRHILKISQKIDYIPDSLLKSMTKEVFRNFAKYLVDFFSFSRLNAENIHELVKIEGLDNITGSLEKGKGVIGLTAHLSNWELSGVALAFSGLPVSIVALNHENTKINRLFINQRAMKGLNVIPVGAGAKQYLNVLKKNEIIGLAGDRLTSGAGIEVNFFDRPTVIPRGPAVLSLRTGAPIVPGFMIRNMNDDFTLVFDEPILPEKYRVFDADGSINTPESEKNIIQQVAFVMEKYIAEYPSHWFIFYKVWLGE